MPRKKNDDFEALFQSAPQRNGDHPLVDDEPVDLTGAPADPLAGGIATSPRSAVDPLGDVVDPSSTLQRRVRKGTDNFDFKALIHGVSTLEKPRAVVPYEAPVEIYKPAGPSKLLALVLVVVCVGIAYYSYRTYYVGASGGASQGIGAVATMGASEYTKKGLPDPKLSPGERDPSGQPKPFNVAVETRTKVLTAYGIDPTDRRYIIVPLIPATLGGTSNAPNLFPCTPWFADLKVRLDRKLTEMVQNHDMTAKQAETELKTNWVQAMHGHYVRNYGMNDKDKARKKENELNW